MLAKTVPLWRSGTVGTCPAGLPEPLAAEEGLLTRGNNNAEQAVRDHRRSVEDSFIRHHYWSPSAVTDKRKEEEVTRSKLEKHSEQTPNLFRAQSMHTPPAAVKGSS